LTSERFVFIENISEVKRPKLTDSKVVKETINFENKSAWRWTEIYEYSLDNESWETKTVAIWFWIGEEDILLIQISAPTSEFAKWEKIFEYMLSSFEFT
jgi:hypothetical protein